MLQVQALSKRLGGRAVLDGLSLEVASGEIYGLLGPNGCGKSTAFNVVCGLLAADAGRVELGGVAVAAATSPAARRIGLCPQEIALYRDLQPAENFVFHGRMHGLDAAAARARAAELVALFGLQPHAGTPVGRLSGGWQQRVNIAVALVHRPQLLVLDEPTAAIDLAGRADLWHVIEDLRAEGTAVLLTTHDLSEAGRLCTRIGLMQHGRLAAEGTPAQLLARVPAQAVAVIDATDAAAAIARASALGWAARVKGDRLVVFLPHAASLAQVVSAFEGVPIRAVGVEPVSLAHAYLELLQEAPDRD